MITRTRVLLGASALAAVSISLVGCSSSGSPAPSDSAPTATAKYYDQLPDSVKAAGKLVIGSDISYPPFEYYDDSNKLAGFEPQLFTPLEDLLGVKLDWENGAFDTLFPGVDSGRYDVEIGATNDRADRDSKYDVVDYMSNGSGFVIAAGNPKNINSMDDLCGLTVAGADGTSQVDLVQQQSTTCTGEGKPAINVLSTGSDPSTAYQAVYSGQADAAVDNYASVVAAVTNSGGKGEASSFQFGLSYLGIFIPKGSPLTQVLMSAMTDLMADPAYKAALDTVNLGDNAIDAPLLNGATTKPLS